MHRHLVWVLVATTALLAGCKDDPAVQARDAGLTCGDNEKLVNGECQFACDRDSDCAGNETCNLLLGQCVAQAPVPDASVPKFPCTTGATRCSADAKGVEQCNGDGEWELQAACPGSGFCQDSVCLACQPGASSCSPTDTQLVNVCLDDGSGARQVTCTGASTCQGGECRECTPNATRCSLDGKTVQTCKKTGNEAEGWRWSNTGDGFDGQCITQVCEATATGAQCKASECFPGTTQCLNGTTQQVCQDTGTWQSRACSSLPGYTPAAQCLSGVCVDECAEAAQAKSYFGCEYWSAVQDNSVETFFKGGTTSGQGALGTDSDFAFVVSNRSESEATVTITRHFGGAVQQVKQETLEGRGGPSKGLKVIKVPWQSLGAASLPDGDSITDLKRYGYKLTSTKPVTVYQFSPLDAGRFSNKNCSADANCNEAANGLCRTVSGTTKRCYYNTFSNDASLLLPAHILGTSHVVMAPDHIVFATSSTSAPSSNGRTHVTIVGTQDGTSVTFRSSAKVLAGGGFPALNKGDSHTLTLNAYDVLQVSTADLGTSYIECGTSPFSDGIFGIGQTCRVDNDLTGTVVTSTKPVAVFGGAACNIVPFSAAACDHLEEQIFPFATWGKTFVAQQSHPLRMQDNTFSAKGAPDTWKIVASCPQSQCPNGTLITLSSPPTAGEVVSGPSAKPNRCHTGSLPTNDCRLLGGQFVAFRKKANFTVTADQPISVGQFFAGQGATPSDTILGIPINSPVQGDPSFILLPPVEQWRSSYTVLTAPGIRDNYLGLVIDDSKVASVSVDGTVVTGFATVSGTPYKVKNHPVSQGSHTITVTPKPGQQKQPGAGVTIYGFDEYVSYGYTGGLDLGTIVDGIDPGG